MPIYEYECEGCHQVFEVRQKMSDPAPAAHSCGSTKVRRILSATTFVLKGTGWYKTDYADKKPQGDTRATEGGDGKSAGDKAEAGKASDKGTDSAKADKAQSAKSEPKPKATPTSDSPRKAN